MYSLNDLYLNSFKTNKTVIQIILHTCTEGKTKLQNSKIINICTVSGKDTVSMSLCPAVLPIINSP